MILQGMVARNSFTLTGLVAVSSPGFWFLALIIDEAVSSQLSD